MSGIADEDIAQIAAAKKRADQRDEAARLQRQREDTEKKKARDDAMAKWQLVLRTLDLLIAEYDSHREMTGVSVQKTGFDSPSEATAMRGIATNLSVSAIDGRAAVSIGLDHPREHLSVHDSVDRHIHGDRAIIRHSVLHARGRRSA